MHFDPLVVDRLAATVDKEDEYTLSGVRITHAPKNSKHKGMINDLTIQNLAVAKALEILGERAWSYGYKSGKRCKEMLSILTEAQDACGYKVQYRTFLRWFQHFLRFGETPAATRRRGGMRRIAGRRATSFTEQDNAELDHIIAHKPYLYLDEIQLEMKDRCNGKVWHRTTLWSQLRRRGYTLKKAVFRARQRSEEERERFMCRLESNTSHPCQYIVIDETHKSANEARRDRAWSMKGKPAVLESYFDRGFGKRYTMIGAANIDGFVQDACHVIEREEGNANDPDRGTVDTEKFEHYVEHYLVPNLGNYSLDEPHSIVIFDNVIIHLSERVRNMIQDAGALLINTAPYSPDLSPIEYFFSIYKAYLKRVSFDGIHWYDAHLAALSSVEQEDARNIFRHCGWPGCKDFGKEEDSARVLRTRRMVCLVAAVLLVTNY